jgi:putative SOS response-associated peptidase YedK
VCGRYSLTAPGQLWFEIFGLSDPPAWAPRYNIAPTQPVAAVLVPPDRPQSQFRLLQWGLIPSWAKAPGVGEDMINARAETAATKPAFRAAFRRRRCLVLADGFYEWPRQGGKKQPFYVRLRDGRPFAFAGLWEHWADPGGQAIDSCALLTTVPNDLIRTFHHRMPVILAPEEYAVWLDPAIQEPDRLQPLLRPYPPEAMTAYPVSTRVNNPLHDTPDCREPLRGVPDLEPGEAAR